MSEGAERVPVVVIGIGNSMRGDDAVGPVAIEMLTEGGDLDADLIVLDGESTRLTDAWIGRSLAIVVDAIRTGRSPGTLHMLEPDDLIINPTAGSSSHNSGIAEAIALGRTIDRMPDRLLLMGIEPDQVDVGRHISAPVAAALPELCARIRAAIG